MTHLAIALFGPDEIFSSFGMWAFLAVGAVSLFGIFIPTVTWLDSRRKEREAFYKAETFRRLTESSTEGAKAAIEMLREESRLERQKRREGMKLGGLICVAVGAAMVIFLRVQTARDPSAPYLVGLIPVFVGVALLVYVYFMSPPAE
jgi:fatty acid desaturase